EVPNDFDFFFLDCNTDTKVHKIKTDISIFISNIGIQFKSSAGYAAKDFNQNVVETYTTEEIPSVGAPFQFILTKYKTREELISDFDFKHCCMSYTPHNDRLFISKNAYECVLNKE